MDIFRTPGAALEGGERKNFDETKDLIDSATNDFLVRADWNANMACVDKVNAIRSPTVMSEVAFLLRKKIASKSAQTVGLTIQLIGVFVNNCGSRFHAILNDERFTRAIADAVRYFSKRPGHDSKDTTDVALDLIQSWGEAFLPRRRDYYHIVDLYFNLRKEGLPFKPQQFDPNRVPIFVDSNSSKAIDNTDAILAASLASELALQEEQEERRRHRGGHHQDTHHSHSHGHDRPRSRQDEYHDEPSRAYGGSPTYGGDSSSGSAESTAEVVQSLRSCMLILKELILAATNVMDFRQNEVAQDVLVQLQVYQSKMPSLIEQGLMTDPEGVEALFALNEDSQSLTTMFNKMKNGDVGLLEGQRQVRGISCGGGESADTFQSVAPAPRHGHHNNHDGHGSRPHSRPSPSPGKGGGANLLDMDFADFPPPAAARHSPAQGHGHHGHQDPFQQHQHHAPHYEQQAQYRSSPVQGHHSSGHPSPGHPPQGHNHAHPPQSRHSPHMMEPAHAGSRLPPPPQAHDPFAPVQAAPRHTHSPHVMHPPAPLGPPQQPHSTKPEGIVRLASDDPFTTDSLDVLFTGTPVVPAQHTQHAPAHATPAKGKELVVSQPSDPFSPDALDALFDTKPPAKKQADPFSEEALDALFITPAPQQAHHGHHAPQQGYPAQQHHYQQQAQQQGYPQHAYPPQQQQQQQAYPQPGYHQPPQAHAYPPQQYQQAHGHPHHQGQQGYPQGQGQGQGHAPQYAARPPQQQQQYQDQSSANPFDLI